ncbi:DUF1707 domain-containing protein [Streptomyces sp. SID5785]|uniref:DUF1707 SHOCT-like domain-containing protein n=1 Tax=Streptomyces sp. SID5785 TaxID=2690309 RepID=UPI001360F684|nr:DUF1707 domain-containing protein [Streptomyces sp. SID5785]MZD06503.1 DUF1707 domain-containing protein [Streptomyces sp. SID5785]
MAEASGTGQEPGGAGTPPALRASHADRDRVVDRLRVAAGDGLLSVDELEERLESALAARTLAELSGLTADLPEAPASGSAAPAKDVLRIERVHSGGVARSGRWRLPRRIELAVVFSQVTLDLSEAEITHDTLHIDVNMTGKTLLLITRPGIVVDADGLQLTHSRVRHRPAPAAPVALRVELAGQKAFGRVVVRPARRSPWRLLRRGPGAAAPAVER